MLQVWQCSFQPRMLGKAVFLVCCWMLATGGLVSARASDANRPNIVIIYADDLGYGDVEAFNPQRCRIKTPNLTRLSNEGMRFTDAHSSSGVCSPSRYALLTGRYHWRSRLQSGIVGLWERPLIPTERLTIAMLAKKMNYRTACIGKWHLGWDWPISEEQKEMFKSPTGPERASAAVSPAQREVWREVFSQKITGGPTSVGFDQYFGTDVPNWPPYCFIENDKTVGIPSEYARSELFKKNQGSLQGPALEGWSFEPILPALVEKSSLFIRDCHQANQPFLLYLPLTTPHTPLAVNQGYQGSTGLGDFADLVVETDAAVGSILQLLDDLDVTRNTIVIFTSDNGCAPYIGVKELEMQGHFPSGPLRGYKSDAWEGGHRVPFMVRWPQVVAANSVSNQLVHQADVMATLAQIWNYELPANAGEDSFSMLSVWHGEASPIRETAVSCSSNGIPALRVGNWKYIAAPGSGGWSKSDPGNTPWQLYDLANDLGETTNLAEQMPEKVTEMQQVLESLIRQGRSNQGVKQSNDVRVQRYPKSKVTSPN